MATNIKLKSSSVANKTPTLSDLSLRELAVNTADGKLFLRKGDGSANDKIVDVTAPLQASEPMGHEDKSQSTISFNTTNRRFTIQPVSTSFNVWCKGIKYNFTTAQTVDLPNTTGIYYIYFDANGALQYRTSYFDWENDAPTAYVYWNATTGTAPFVADERHGIVLDWQTHEYLHRTRGAVIANGFSISNYSTSGDGTNNADSQFDLGGGTFFDEDLEVIITHSNTPTSDTWQQDLAGPSQIPVFYQSGTAWVRDAPTDYALKQGTSRIRYNYFNGATWSAIDVSTDTWYTTSWIIATNNINYPVIAIMGQSAHNKISDEESLTFGDLILDGFPVVEFRPLYKIIWQTDEAYTNTPKARIAGVYDIRQLSSGGGVSGTVPVSDHGLLTGLGDDDHLQYVHISENRTISASHTISGTLSITNATEASSTTTGALTVTGGVGIAGDLYVGGNLDVGALQISGIQQGDTNVTITDTGSDGKITFTTDGTVAGAINNSQYFGMGTDNPLKPLHVYNASINNVLFVESGDEAANIVQSDNAGSTLLRSAGGLFQIYTGGDASDKDATNSTVKITVLTTGEVGFGTETPAKKVEIAANNDAGGQKNTLRFTDTDTNTAANQQIGKIEFYSGDTSDPGAGVKAYIGSFATGITPAAYLSFATQTGTTVSTPVERLRITDTGNVGINTINVSGGLPLAKLHVYEAGLTGTDVSTVFFENTVTDVNADTAFTQKILTTLSGSDAATADREQGGLYVKVNSTSTGGDTSNEHRAYGILTVLDVTGDSDVAYGTQSTTQLSHTDGTISNAIGAYGVTSHNSSGPVTYMYGTYGLAQPTSSCTAPITYVVGHRGRTNFSGTAAPTVTNVFGVWGNVDNDAGTAITHTGLAACFYGSYDSTVGLNNTYGVYINANVKNYFEGTVGIGTDNPIQTLHVAGTGTITGNVGIGTTNPGKRLHVYSDDPEVIIVERQTNNNCLIEYKSSGGSMFAGLANAAIGWGVDSDNNLGTSPHFLITRTTGNVGIGTSNPSGGHVHIDANQSSSLYSYRATGENSIFCVSGDSSVAAFRVQNSQIHYRFGIQDTNSFILRDVTNTSDRVTLTSTGNVGIGITNPTYKLQVNGSFAATTKSFVIPHPTKEGMTLRYGSLEGPENGVYVRGRITGSNTIELPDYWTGLVDEDTITVNLTPIGRNAGVHSVIDIADNTVVIESSNDNIDCFYMILGERKDVAKLEVEF